MKLTSILPAVISVALLATNAHAVIYSDLDVYNGLTGRLVNGSNPLTGSFQISSQDNDGINDQIGYDSATQTIESATVSFLLYDDSFVDGSERVTIDLGSDTFVNNQAATFLFAYGGVTGSALLDLDDDGILEYSIVADRGDFRVSNGLLTVDAQPRTVSTAGGQPTAVPDGGMTIILLGMGFLGICALQRKFALAP